MANQLLDGVEPSTSPHPHRLLSTLLTLRQAVEAEGLAIFDQWKGQDSAP